MCVTGQYYTDQSKQQQQIAMSEVSQQSNDDAFEYELTIGDTIVEDSYLLTDVSTIQQILHWIGFREVETRENIYRNDSIGSFDEIQLLTEKDVQAIATNWAGRTASLGRFHIGNQRLKYLQSLIHWVQDFRRISATPTIVGLNEHTFKS